MTRSVNIPRASHRGLAVTRNGLLLSCASLAIATAVLTPSAAEAQAFLGSISSNTGTVSRNITSGSTETITVGSNTATINWAPNDQQIGGGTINFLPSGNTATFTSASGITDYTVVNYIVPTDATRAISLNGHVISTLQGTSTTGGNVWFDSPGGIVIGPTAVFDVGGLLLTTNNVTSFTNSPGTFTGTFSGPASSLSKVQIDKGAQINALQQDSYFAVVAPRIEQGGTARVNGSVAYAAGEQVGLTWSQGLFDVSVSVGTTDPNGIVHTGETSGPANASASDNHSITMVAVPKNQAMTVLLGGNIGFDATTAVSQNGAIYLSSGFNFNGVGPTGSAQGGSIDIGSLGAANFTSQVFAVADADIKVAATSGNISFAGDVTLEDDLTPGVGDIHLGADNGNTLSFSGNAGLFAGNNVDISADHGGGVNVTGTLTADAPNTLSLFDDNGLGAINADTLSFFAANFSDQAQPTITNIFGDFSGDATVSGISAPGQLEFVTSGNLTADNLTAGTFLDLFQAAI